MLASRATCVTAGPYVAYVASGVASGVAGAGSGLASGLASVGLRLPAAQSGHMPASGVATCGSGTCRPHSASVAPLAGRHAWIWPSGPITGSVYAAEETVADTVVAAMGGALQCVG